MPPPGFPQDLVYKSDVIAKIMERAAAGGKDLSGDQVASIFDKIFANNRQQYDAGETKTMILDFDDPALEGANNPLEAGVEGVISGATASNLDIFPSSSNLDPLARVAGAGGHLAGMLLGPLKLAGAAKIPGAIGFGAYGAASPADSGGDRLKNAMMNVGLYGGLKYAPKVISGAAKKVSPKAGQAFDKAMETKGGRFAYDLGIFSGMAKAASPDAPIDEWLPEAVGGAAVATGLNFGGTRNKGKKPPAPADPAEVAKLAELEALIAEARPKAEKRTDPTPAEVDALDTQLKYDNAVRAELADIQRQLDPTLPRPANRATQVVATGRPGEAVQLPDMRHNPSRDAAMRKYNEAIAGRKTELLGEYDYAPEIKEYLSNRLPVPTNIPAETGRLPDLRPSPGRDAAMRKYNEIIGGPRRLIGHEPTAHRFSPHGYGEVMRGRQFGPVVDEPMAPHGGQFRQGKVGEPRARVRRGARRGQDFTTDMLGGQQMYEGLVSRAGKLRAKASWGKEYWKQFTQDAISPVEGNPITKPFSRHLNDEIAFRDIPAEIRRSGAYLDPVSSLPKEPAEAIRVLEKHLDPELVRDVKNGVIQNVNINTTVDRAAQAEGLGGGTHNSAFVRTALRTNQMSDMSMMKGGTELRLELNDIIERHGISGKDLETTGKLLDLWKTNQWEPDFLTSRKVEPLLMDTSSPRRTVEFLREMRPALDVYHGIMDQTDRAYGGSGVGRIDSYFPKVPVDAKWYQLGEKWERAEATEGKGEKGKTSTRDDKFNPRKMHRKSTDPDMVDLDGREVPRDWNIRSVLDGYVDNVTGSVSGTAAVRNNAQVVKYLELMDKPLAAESLNRTTQHIYNRERVGFGGGVDSALDSTPVGRVALGALTRNKRLFDASHYRLNPKFSFGTQWTSLIPQIATHPLAAAKALPDLANPAAWDAMRSTYTATVKGQPRAGVGYQADASPYVSDALNKPGAIRGAGRTFADGLTNGMESFTNVYSGLIAEHSKTAAGLKGKNRTDYVSSQQQKWQSMYNFQDRAAALNSRFLQGTNPAQAYNVEFFNRVRETAGRSLAAGGKIGLDSGKGQFAKDANAGYLVGIALMSNLTRAYVLGYGGFQLRDIVEASMGMIPWGQMAHGFGPSGGKSLTASDLARVYRMSVNMTEGDYYDVIKDMMRWVKGGTFAADIMREAEGEGPYSDAFEIITKPLGGPSEGRR